jgi:heterodisulfide reductase subunit C
VFTFSGKILTRNWLHEFVFNANIQKIRDALRHGSKNKWQLHQTTNLSRPTIDKYLQILTVNREVVQEGRRFSLSYQGYQELERTEQIHQITQTTTGGFSHSLEADTNVPLALSQNTINTRFRQDVEQLSGQKIAACYVCGKCSAGCPIASSMDTPPHEILRLIQLGQEAEILHTNTIWLCSSCLTCTSRCPKGISLTHVMEAIRVLQLRKGILPELDLQLPSTLLSKAPQLALVSYFRKYGT